MNNLKQQLEKKLNLLVKSKKECWADWKETKDEGSRELALQKRAKEELLLEVLELLK